MAIWAAANIGLVAEVEHLERERSQAGQQVRAGCVVVIHPHQAVERLEDARQVRARPASRTA